MNLRDIKTKQKMQAIKTKDTKGNIQHFIKEQTIHNKKVDRKEEASVKSNPQVQATNKVSVAAKQSVIESKHRATKFIKQKHHEYKIKSANKKPIIESNHDINMLQIGPYPYALKRRIWGNKGHLSNETCGNLLNEIISDRLKKVILGHLSKENNLPELAYETIRNEINMADGNYCADDISIQVASRTEPSCHIEF